MKEKKKKEKGWDTLKPPASEPLPGKTIKNKTGKMVQYPPNVGHHGTDQEKDLSPEE